MKHNAKDVTNDFYKAVIDRFGGYREIIEDKKDDKYFMVEVKKITEEEAIEFKESLEKKD